MATALETLVFVDFLQLHLFTGLPDQVLLLEVVFSFFFFIGFVRHVREFVREFVLFLCMERALLDNQC